jgi:hypothetical protein
MKVSPTRARYLELYLVKKSNGPLQLAELRILSPVENVSPQALTEDAEEHR